jgi:hypothetical protein
MFDRSTLVLGGPTHHHSHTTIKQQPHDAADAARLFGELKDKAEKAVTDLVHHRLSENELTFVTYTQNLSAEAFEPTYHVALKINGVPYNIRVTYDQMAALRAGNARKMLEEVVLPAVSSALLTEMLKTTNDIPFISGRY